VDALLLEALEAPRRGRGVAIVYSPTRRAAEEEQERLSRAAGARASTTRASRATRAPAQAAFRRDAST
jgi:hypothetical protein